MTDGPFNSGVSMAGQKIAAELKRQAGSPISQGPANKWSVDYSDVTALKTEIHGVVTEVGLLENAIKDLVTTLKNAAPHLAQLGGGGGGKAGASGGTGLTAAGFSGGSGGGSKGSTITAASFSGGGRVSGFMGKVANGLAFGAAGELAAGASGYINSYMNQTGPPGMASNLMSTQSNQAFGLGVNQTGRNGVTATSQTNARVPSFGQTDAAHAQSIEQANMLLWAPNGSQRQKNLSGFYKAASGLSPGMGAAGTAQWANTLASPGAQAMINRYGGGQDSLLLRGGKGINKAAPAFKVLMRVLLGGKTEFATPDMLKKGAKNDNLWYGIAANFGENSQMGLTNAELTAMRNYAAAGGDLTAAANALSNTPAATSLNKSTAKNRLDTGLYQGRVTGENARNRMAAAGYNKGADLANANPSAVDAAGWVAAVSSSMLGLASVVAKAASAVSLFEGALKGKGGGGGGGGLPSVIATGGRGAAAVTTTAATVGTAEVAGGVAGGTAAVGATAVALPLAVFGGIALGVAGAHGMPLNDFGKGRSGYLPGVPAPDPRQNIAANSPTSTRGGRLAGIGDPTGSTTTSGMTPTMKRRVSSMMAANPNVKISSGHRTRAQQSYLYRAKGGHQVARPGNSAHQSGQAADLGPPSQFGWIAANASKFGLGRPDPGGEPWHVQAIGDPVSPVGGGLKIGRTDQGVDYSGAGSLYAVGAGTILSVRNAGWPGGAFISLKLDSPPDAQHSIVYYAEDISPSVSIGQHVKAGDVIGQATNGSSGIELGWGSSTIGQSLQADTGAYSGSGATAQGQNFLNWLHGASTAGQSAAAAASTGGKAVTGKAAAKKAAVAAGGRVPGLVSGFLSSIKQSWLSSGMSGSSNQVIGASALPSADSAAAKTSGGSKSGTSSSGGAKLSNTASGGNLSPKAVYDLAIAAGLSPQAAQIATAVSSVETGGSFNPQANNHNTNGTTDYGLWQINSVHGVGTEMYNPSANAAEMAKLTNNGSSWGPWAPDFGASTYGGNPPMGGKVQAAMQALGFMGDPGMGGGGSAVVTGGLSGFSRQSQGRIGTGGRKSGGGNTFNLSMPIQVVGATQAEASRLANMVLLELQKQAGIDAMSGS